MDIIHEILLTFDDQATKEFRHHLIRQRPDAERKDLLLFDALMRNETPESRGTAAYHANRKRLTRALTEFIILKQMKEDTGGAGEVLGALSAGLYLFDQKRNEAAWHFLLKAEAAATATQRPDALLQVYRIMADHLHKQDQMTLDQLETKAQSAARLSAVEDRVRFALSRVRQRLGEAKRKGMALNMGLIADLTSVPDTDRPGPRQMLRLIEMLRSAALSGRDVRQFRDYLAEHYARLQAEMAGNPVFAAERVLLASIYAHALFRTRGFALMEGPLRDMADNMASVPALQKAYAAKYVSLRGSAQSLIGNNEEAIRLHVEFLEKQGASLSTEDRLNMELNLVFFRFNSGEFGKASRLLSLMHHSRAWYENRMGAEWVMRMELIRGIVRFELDDPEQALRIIEQLRKSYAHVLATGPYAKAGAFIDLVIRFLRNPEDLNRERVVEVSKSVLSDIPAGREDTNQLAFYCWLLSKANRQPYYETLLANVE